VVGRAAPRPGSAAPDSAGPILGWRVWRVSRVGPALRLRSVLRDTVWEPGDELVAACDGGHDAPDEACSCGVHAARERDAATRYLIGRNEPGDVARVVGLVALWGWVLVAEAGWRASFAYPARLVVPSGTADAPAVASALAAYRVPVELA
jgi:hypothetical protein